MDYLAVNPNKKCVFRELPKAFQDSDSLGDSGIPESSRGRVRKRPEPKLFLRVSFINTRKAKKTHQKTIRRLRTQAETAPACRAEPRPAPNTPMHAPPQRTRANNTQKLSRKLRKRKEKRRVRQRGSGGERKRARDKRKREKEAKSTAENLLLACERVIDCRGVFSGWSLPGARA